jgi:hypothetical protein
MRIVAMQTESLEPSTRRWTREEFYRLAEIGLFNGQRAELIEGEIRVLSPQKSTHYFVTDRVTRVLESVFWGRLLGAQARAAELQPLFGPGTRRVGSVR